MTISELIVLEKLFQDDQPIGGKAVFVITGSWANATPAQKQHQAPAFAIRATLTILTLESSIP